MFNLDNADWQYLGQVVPNGSSLDNIGHWMLPGQGWLTADSPGALYWPDAYGSDQQMIFLPDKTSRPEDFLRSSEPNRPGKKKIMAVKTIAIKGDDNGAYYLAPAYFFGAAEGGHFNTLTRYSYLFESWLNLFENRRLEMEFASDNARCRGGETGPWTSAVDYSGPEYVADEVGVCLPTVSFKSFYADQSPARFVSLQMWIAFGEKRNLFWTGFRASREV